MMNAIPVGDGYVKFVEGNEIIAEVYALANHDKWRVRIPGLEDADLSSRDEAVNYVHRQLDK